MNSLSLPQRRLLIVTTAIAILLVGGAVVIASSTRIAAQRWVDHTFVVLRTADDVERGLVNAENGQRGFLLTGSEAYLEPYTAAIRQHAGALERLDRLVADNPDQQHRVDSIRTLAAAWRAELDSTIAVGRFRGPAAATAMVESGHGRQLMDSIRSVTRRVRNTESALLAERQAHARTLATLVLLIAGLGTLAGVALTLLQGGLLSRSVAAQETLTDELADRARALEDTAGELEMSNEELHAANEQLQNTIEELQTTTEELESSNDELHRSRTDLEAGQVELARSEARFRTLAEYLPVSLFMCGADGSTEYVNPAWSALTGTSRDRAVADGWTASVHPADWPRVEERWRGALGGDPVELHFRYVRPDGNSRHVRVTSRAVRNAAGQITAVLGTGVDLTERLEQEEQLRHAQRMQAVGRLAGGMAHELNNMLTASIGFGVYALRKLPVDHEAVRDIAESLKAQERAARITSQVLSFSRRQMLAPTRFELKEAIEELVPLLQQSLLPGQSLQLMLADELGPVYVDRTRLDQAVLNLALNARDAMPDGGTLTVRARRAVIRAGVVAGPEGERLRPGPYLVISLEDSGTGMDAETRRRAPEPFFTTKALGQGTGLGLSMAYGFVRQSEGTLVIESEPERGTTVSLFLPVAPPDPSGDGRLAVTGRDESPSGEHILVVEDEPSVRSSMRRALEEQGYEVVEAGSGAEALVRLAEVPGGVHLVVCDLIMPEMSGGTLGATIRDRWPALPVLYVSGFPGAEGDETMMPSGAPFLKKPFSPEALTARVRSVLDGR